MKTDTELECQVREKMRLRELGVDVKTSNTLFRTGYTDIEQITSLSEEDLRNIRGIGEVGIAQIRSALVNYSQPTFSADVDWATNNQDILYDSDHTWS